MRVNRIQIVCRGPINVKFRPVMAHHEARETTLGMRGCQGKNQTENRHIETGYKCERRVNSGGVFESYERTGCARRLTARLRVELCGRMYRPKALLRHLPNRLMVEAGTPEWAADVAAPIRKLCVLNAAGG